MIAFVLGSLAFSAFLAWHTYTEWQQPVGWRAWAEAALVIGAQVCVFAVTVKAAFS